MKEPQLVQEPLILLVEDRADDVLMLRRSFHKAGIYNPIQVVRDGEEAINYLLGIGTFSDRIEFPLPELILLDLKMPKVDGFEVLTWVRSQRNFSGIRVIVLSSSESIQDINRAYKLGANSFLVKPADFNSFVELSGFISEYWFVLSKSPQISRGSPKWGVEIKKKDVLLRQKQSGRLYAGHGRWVGAQSEALNFERIELAEALAAAERLDGVEIVLLYERPACELTVPVLFPGCAQP
jgi:CheY-like chemotaxis protein